MNIRGLLSLMVVAILTLVPSWLMMGCENEDSPHTGDLDSYFEDHPFLSDPRDPTSPRVVSISPESASVSFPGQQISFTASGGTPPYGWETANTENGTVAALSGAKAAVYTTILVAPNDVIAYDQNGYAAVATINGPTTTLLATADPGELDVDNALSVLTASGGVPPYTWTVGDTALGEIRAPNVGSSVVYQRSHSPDNTVTVKDAAGDQYTIVIKQP
jgi:hypothetical protein